MRSAWSAGQAIFLRFERFLMNWRRLSGVVCGDTGDKGDDLPGV